MTLLENCNGSTFDFAFIRERAEATSSSTFLRLGVPVATKKRSEYQHLATSDSTFLFKSVQ